MDKEQVLIGSLLGDGCISKRGRLFFYQESHSALQTEYLRWKSENLPFKVTFRITNRKSQPAIWSRYIDLSYYYGLKYEHEDRPFELVNKLSSLGFLVWYLDDGTCKYSNRTYNFRLVLCKCGKFYEEKGAKRVQELLNYKFGVKGTLYYDFNESGSNQFRIYYSSGETQRLKEMWKEFLLFMPSSVNYKLGDESKMQIARSYDKVYRKVNAVRISAAKALRYKETITPEKLQKYREYSKLRRAKLKGLL